MDHLQCLLEEKNEQINGHSTNCDELEMNLAEATMRNARLEQTVLELQGVLHGTDDYEAGEQVVMSNVALDECNLNIIVRKVTENVDELKDLRVDYQVQGNAIDMYKRDLDSTRVRYRDEVVELKRMVSFSDEIFAFVSLVLVEDTRLER